jgi:hypothetical protein
VGGVGGLRGREGRGGRGGRGGGGCMGRWGCVGGEVGVGWSAAYTGQQLSAHLFISQIIKDD